MSEIKDSKVKAEITVINKKNHKVQIVSGRYGTFSEAYEHASKLGFQILSYKSI